MSRDLEVLPTFLVFTRGKANYLFFGYFAFLCFCNRKLRRELFDTNFTAAHIFHTYFLGTQFINATAVIACPWDFIPLPNMKKLVLGTETEKKQNFQMYNFFSGNKTLQIARGADIIISTMLQAERKASKAEGVNQ